MRVRLFEPQGRVGGEFRTRPEAERKGGHAGGAFWVLLGGQKHQRGKGFRFQIKHGKTAGWYPRGKRRNESVTGILAPWTFFQYFCLCSFLAAKKRTKRRASHPALFVPPAGRFETRPQKNAGLKPESVHLMEMVENWFAITWLRHI